MEELFSNPLVLLVIGFVISEWRQGRDGHTKAVKVDTELVTRLAAVESWQRDHNAIHGCVQRLAATTEAMAKNVDRLTRRLDQWMASHPLTLEKTTKGPFDYQNRSWLYDDAGA